MRNVNDLEREQLVAIVSSIQSLLYLEVDAEQREYWNPDKSWNGANVCEETARLLGEHGLTPEIEEPVHRQV